LGGVLALLVGAVAVWWATRDDLVELTAADLAAAEARWQQSGCDDYDLTVQLSGRRSGVFKVRVRDGKSVQVTLDGISPRRGTWETWTVPGQFETLGLELENAADGTGPFGAPPGATVVLRVQFDPELGYPREYRRSVLGTPLEISWEVTEFRR